MTQILVTNDDGIFSTGISALAKSLETVGSVTVVAPDREMSAISHALTLDRPLRITELGERRFMVDGTPSDCVYLALEKILKKEPALLFSGINRGANLGDDITYSGTVSAAIEGTLLGVTSVAMSLCTDEAAPDFQPSGELAVWLAKKILHTDLPGQTLLNVNVPVGKLKGVRVTEQGKRLYKNNVEVGTDPRGKPYYWIGGQRDFSAADSVTDYGAINDGLATITPLHLDLTDYKLLKEISHWQLHEPSK